MKSCNIIVSAAIALLILANFMLLVNAQTYTLSLTFGSSGSGNGQFLAAGGIAVDSSGNIYVIDGPNGRIQKFSSSGAYLTQWGSFGSDNGQFNDPIGIAVDNLGNVYVSEALNSRIQKFSSSGEFIASFGFGYGELSGIAVDNNGNVYVADMYNRVNKFNSSGYCLWSTGNGKDTTKVGDYPNVRYSLAVDSSGNVYEADTLSNRIVQFSSSGAYVTQWGSYGSGTGQFNAPWGIAADNLGNLYIIDAGNNHIDIFTNSGTYIAQLSNANFSVPWGIAVDISGSIYVTNQGNNLIQKFNADVPISSPSATPNITPSPILTPSITATPLTSTPNTTSPLPTYNNGSSGDNVLNSIIIALVSLFLVTIIGGLAFSAIKNNRKLKGAETERKKAEEKVRQAEFEKEEAERKRQEAEKQAKKQQGQTSQQPNARYDDPYEVLGIPKNASKEQVKDAWRRLCKKYHPDVTKDKDSTTQELYGKEFDKVNKAKEEIFRRNGWNN
jgi:sugar lactone lactonase YvrE